MNADNLVNKEKLLAIIEKIGKAPWEKGEGVEKLIPLGAVIEAIEAFAQKVSPAELAGILKGKAWVLEKLDEWLYELVAVIKDQWVRRAYSITREKLGDLESQAPVSELALSDEDRRKAEAWDKFMDYLNKLHPDTLYGAGCIRRDMDELLAQSKEEKP